MRRRCVDGLGLARRAGALVVGFDKVVDALQHGQVGLLIMAADSSDGQRRRLLPLAEGVSVATCLSRDEVGGAVGREEATYAAVSAGTLALRLERDLRRLAGILGDVPSEGPAEPVGEDEDAGLSSAKPLGADAEDGHLPMASQRVEPDGQPLAGESDEPAQSARMLTGPDGARSENEDDDAA
ncbi:hypothetical protein SAMN07250955_101183 [Arboricoccus pini]|uniref:Ribosomal protein eL8/eL30/eS12/Gadd45 domain-containing protein n=1 Tax=Arboricoccus pini TaxID=1963835 RepID=A0A212PYQ7_9PROT|nr:ribosomal L7Ae/L30e/S12e/Gadd45 family protein [Arboricoccus pini]SNB52094.1 hypothetical protein SAMN07250955_101183 [Arboricoccus pini]